MIDIDQSVQWLRSLPISAVGKCVSDSRKVQSGDVFFAYPVGNDDGRNYIQQAIDQGAQAVMYEQENFSWNPSWGVPHLAVKDLLWHAGFIVGAYLSQPDASLFTVAVTGTNGKTSCTQWIARAISMSGTQACVIGTLGVSTAKNGLMSECEVTGFTTPDAIQLQQKLMVQREHGVGALAIEASSIGLQQGRMNGMHVDVAVLTNFTRDHLDFHGDMAHYEAAKTLLFTWPGLKTAVVNLDDAFGGRLAQLCKSRGTKVIGYRIKSNGSSGADGVESVNADTVLQASGLRHYHGGASFYLESPFGSGTVKTQVIGHFNVSNMLAVMSTLFVRGFSWQEVVHSVEQLTPVVGRMEHLNVPSRSSDRVLVIIDYAHTPDALEKTLLNLREVAMERHGKLWCVFGCGGDRDAGKRPEMGKIAELADEIIVTSDNPRHEEPEAIMAQIAAGFTPTRQPVPMMELDRAKAILFAIKHAGKNDVVLLAGKGHESYQEIKGKRIPFSDMDHAHIALANIASKGVGL